MRRIDIAAGYRSSDVELVAECLNEEGIGIIPTDTVYGLAALATSEKAINRLLEIKARPADKPLPVQCSSMSRAAEIAVLDLEPARSLASAFWPGALTLVLDMKPGITMPYQGPHTIGIRIPGNGFCLSLLELVGYLVVPSANSAGSSPPEAAVEIESEITEVIDFLVNGGRCSNGMPSTVVDVSSVAAGDLDNTGAPPRHSQPGNIYKILREGAITKEKIEKAIDNE